MIHWVSESMNLVEQLSEFSFWLWKPTTTSIHSLHPEEASACHHRQQQKWWCPYIMTWNFHSFRCWWLQQCAHRKNWKKQHTKKLSTKMTCDKLKLIFHLSLLSLSFFFSFFSRCIIHVMAVYLLNATTIMVSLLAQTGMMMKIHFFREIITTRFKILFQNAFI